MSARDQRLLLDAGTQTDRGVRGLKAVIQTMAFTEQPYPTATRAVANVHFDGAEVESRLLSAVDFGFGVAAGMGAAIATGITT